MKRNEHILYTILIRSHQNDTSNLSPALIQPQVERRPLTGLQFDVQQKIKLILGESHFRASEHLHLEIKLQSLILGNIVVSAIIMKLDQARK